jgi:hypothetical protein
MVNTRKNVLSGSALAPLAIGAALARWVIHPARVKTLTLSGHLFLAAFVVELLFTFGLYYVVPAAVIACFIGHPDRPQRQLINACQPK